MVMEVLPGPSLGSKQDVRRTCQEGHTQPPRPGVSQSLRKWPEGGNAPAEVHAVVVITSISDHNYKMITN